MRDPERKSDILVEARELASALARELLQLGADGDGHRIDELFRTAHSLKGLAGLLGAAEAVGLAEAIEDVFDDLRHFRARLIAPLRAALLEAIERCGYELIPSGAAPGSELIARLEQLRIEAGVGASADPLAGLELPQFLVESLTEFELARLAENLRRGRRIYRVIAGFALTDFDRGLEAIRDRSSNGGELIATLPASTEAEISFELLLAMEGDASRLDDRLAGIPVRIEPVPFAATAKLSASAGVADQRVRVSLRALRELERLAGEMAADARSLDATDSARARIESLQEQIRQLGSMPAADLCRRVEQTTAALATAWGRQVRLEAKGTEIELPIELAEALLEPLLHLVRNAIDHGIEAAEERFRAGKPSEGTIRLSFARDDAALEVELSDDGAGIDPVGVRESAIAQGHVEPAAWLAMPAEERLQLVFAPGVSVGGRAGHSGRGVGLDVVRTAAERMGGQVQVRSIPGAGTSFTLRLPIGR